MGAQPIKTAYPEFDIGNLAASKLLGEQFHADRLNWYFLNNPQVHKVHKHSFYHLVYFSSGTGEHIIDFRSFPIKKGMIYFMRPGQVHEWKFDEGVEGYIVNFSPGFFDQLSISSATLEQYPFFSLFSAAQVLELDTSDQKKAMQLFEVVLREVAEKQIQAPVMIASLLLQLFVLATRAISPKDMISSLTGHNSVLVKSFLKLVEEHFKESKLPRDYASKLFITSNHLNFICKEQINRQAGEVIRARVLLEAKRLLVNVNLSISAVAMDLNFSDTSYFIKFFRKYTHLTPESFRRQFYNKPKPKASASLQ
jgi:AraC family transcriptional activator of pobA